jgi:Uma2 family endonuclease
MRTGAGKAVAPGVIFAEDDDVAPDVVWISRTRQATALGRTVALHAAPELVVEILSLGPLMSDVTGSDSSSTHAVVCWNTGSLTGRPGRSEVYRRENSPCAWWRRCHATDT